MNVETLLAWLESCTLVAASKSRIKAITEEIRFHERSAQYHADRMANARTWGEFVRTRAVMYQAFAVCDNYRRELMKLERTLTRRIRFYMEPR